jgi:hypothetical protein
LRAVIGAGAEDPERCALAHGDIELRCVARADGKVGVADVHGQRRMRTGVKPALRTTLDKVRIRHSSGVGGPRGPLSGLFTANSKNDLARDGGLLQHQDGDERGARNHALWTVGGSAEFRRT